MTHRLQTSAVKKWTMVCFGILSLTTVILSSCTKEKKESNDAAKFIGVWHGTDCGGSSEYTISAGSNNSSIQLAAWFGNGACQKNVQVQCSVSGNNFTCASQSFTDVCGNNYTTYASGSINGSTLTMNNTIVDALGTFGCSFSGTK